MYEDVACSTAIPVFYFQNIFCSFVLATTTPCSILQQVDLSWTQFLWKREAINSFFRLNKGVKALNDLPKVKVFNSVHTSATGLSLSFPFVNQLLVSLTFDVHSTSTWQDDYIGGWTGRSGGLHCCYTATWNRGRCWGWSGTCVGIANHHWRGEKTPSI